MFHHQWYIDHYIKFDPKSVDFIPYRIACSIIFASYAWEMISHKRGKFHSSEAIHHWVTAIFCCLMMQGYYIPTATYYGTFLVQLLFPIGFVQGMRAVYPTIVKNSDLHEQWANFIRNVSKCSIYWYIICVIMNLTGQGYVYFGRMFHVFDSNISIIEMIALPIAVIAWLNDDYALLKALIEYSRQEYELAAGLRAPLPSPRDHSHPTQWTANLANINGSEMSPSPQLGPTKMASVDTFVSDNINIEVQLSPPPLR